MQIAGSAIRDDRPPFPIPSERPSLCSGRIQSQQLALQLPAQRKVDAYQSFEVDRQRLAAIDDRLLDVGCQEREAAKPANVGWRGALIFRELFHRPIR